MDDDLPKEGVLLDITRTKKSKESTESKDSSLPKESQPTKIPFGVIGVLVIIAGIALLSQVSLGGKAKPEEVATYKLNTQSIFDSMKAQFPYLVSLKCEGSDPNKGDCINFVGTFRPDKESPSYLSSMGTIDKVQGATPADIELIKGHVKVLADIKRTTLTSARKPFTFLIDSVTIPKVGPEISVKTKCTESGPDNVVCETIR